MSNPSLVAHVAKEQSPSGGERLRFARFICVVAAGAALPGCALLPHRTVYRYVSTACVTREQYAELKSQEPPKIHSRLNGDEDHDIKIIAGSLIRVRSYADGLLEVLGGCQEPDTHQIADKLLNDSSK